MTHPLADEIREGLIQTVALQAKNNGDSHHIEMIGFACESPFLYLADILSNILDAHNVPRDLDIGLFTPDEDCPWECHCPSCKG